MGRQKHNPGVAKRLARAKAANDTRRWRHYYVPDSKMVDNEKTPGN